MASSGWNQHHHQPQQQHQTQVQPPIQHQQYHYHNYHAYNGYTNSNPQPPPASVDINSNKFFFPTPSAAVASITDASNDLINARTLHSTPQHSEIQMMDGGDYQRHAYAPMDVADESDIMKLTSISEVISKEKEQDNGSFETMFPHTTNIEQFTERVIEYPVDDSKVIDYPQPIEQQPTPPPPPIIAPPDLKRKLPPAPVKKPKLQYLTKPVDAEQSEHTVDKQPKSRGKHMISLKKIQKANEKVCSKSECDTTDDSEPEDDALAAENKSDREEDEEQEADVESNQSASEEEEEEEEEEATRCSANFKVVVNKPPQQRRVYNKANSCTVKQAMPVLSIVDTDPNKEKTRKYVNDFLNVEAEPCFEAQIDQSRRFIDFYVSKLYHMFLIRPGSDNKPFDTRYVSTVHSVTSEYRKYYSSLGNRIVIVTLGRYRFLIVERLLDDMNITIPLAERVDAPKEDEVSFNEVKDVNFMNLLVQTFNLNTLITQTELAFLYSALPKKKALYVHDKLARIVQDDTLFTLPINLARDDTSAPAAAVTDSNNGNVIVDHSQYVADITEKARVVRFATASKKISSNPSLMQEFVESLENWLPQALIDHKQNNKKVVRDFTYKYGSVASLFYNKHDTNSLRHVRKEKSANRQLIEYYLDANREPTTHSFILINTKSEERMTIIKKEHTFVWINCVHSEIVPCEIIKKFKYGSHYVFSLIRVTRKEINARHNGMLKLMAAYTSGSIEMKHVIRYAKKLFTSEVNVIEYDDGQLVTPDDENRDSSPPPSKKKKTSNKK